MELPNDIFSEIAGVAVSEPVYELAHERRKHPRVGFGGRARVAPLFDTMSARGVTVMLRDVSPAGVGFLSPQRLETSDEFVICLRSKSEKLIKIHCIVRRCDPGGVGLTQFDVGATFELVLETNAAPEETSGANEIGASPAALEVSVAGIAPRSGGPIKRLLIRPVVRLFSGIWSSINAYRDNSKLRRRLKTHRRKEMPAEESAAPAAASSQGAVAINDNATAPLSAPSPMRPFTPRVGGLFLIDSSKTPLVAEPTQPPVAPVAPATEVPAMPTIEVAAPVVPVVVAPIVETPIISVTSPIEVPVVEAPTIAAPILEPVVQDVPATSGENPTAPTVVEVQLEIPWTTIEHVVQSPPITPVVPVLDPSPATVAEPALVMPAAVAPAVEPNQTEEELVVVKSTEPTPVHRTQSAVVGLLQKRRSAVARHPRRHPQY